MDWDFVVIVQGHCRLINIIQPEIAKNRAAAVAFQSDVSGRDRLGKLTRNIFRVVNEQLDLFSIHDKFEMILRIAGCIYASRIPNERPAVPYLGDDSPLLLCKYTCEFVVSFILIVEHNPVSYTHLTLPTKA